MDSRLRGNDGRGGADGPEGVWSGWAKRVGVEMETQGKWVGRVGVEEKKPDA